MECTTTVSPSRTSDMASSSGRRVFAGRLVGEGAIEGDAVELALDVLVDAADPDVADPLPSHRGFFPACQVELQDLASDLSIEANRDFILTVLAGYPDSQVGVYPKTTVDGLSAAG